MIHSFFSEFTDPKIETEYQRFHLKQLNTILIIGLCLFFFNNNLFIYYDLTYIFDLNRMGHIETIYIRIFYSLVILTAIISIIKKNNPNITNRFVLIFFISTSLITLAIQELRQTNSLSTYTVEVLVSLTFYFVFPIKLKYQILGGCFFSLVNIYTVYSLPYPEDRQVLVTILLISTNVFGYFVSKYHHKDKRTIFLLFNREHELNHKLEAAMHDVKTLSGVIPICSNCKKIRDDQGYWNQLEAFISSHSYAKFTHSVCEECSKEMIEEFKKDIKDSND